MRVKRLSFFHHSLIEKSEATHGEVRRPLAIGVEVVQEGGQREVVHSALQPLALRLAQQPRRRQRHRLRRQEVCKASSCYGHYYTERTE